MIKYRISSKSLPSLTLMHVTCDNFEESKKRQLFMLAHRIHPIPEMYNHLIKCGILDFDFIPETIIEKAIITPEKETRKKFKSSKADSTMD
jgi:hypothetical protein